MPEVSTVDKGGHIRHVFQAQPGESFMICRCYQSKEFPFCDGTHRTVEGNVAPAVIEIANPDDEEKK